MLLRSDRIDSDDFFADTRMSFGDHIEELRSHLLRAIGGFFIALIFGFIIGQPVMEFIAAPIGKELDRFYDRRDERNEQLLAEGDKKLTDSDQPREIPIELDLRELRRKLFPDAPAGQPEAGDKSEEWVTIRARIRPTKTALALSRASRRIGMSRSTKLSAFSVTETLIAWLKVSMACGVVLASPWIFWQLWSFIAAGLYPHERRHVYAYLPGSILLFLFGVLLCEIVVLPAAVSYLLAFNEWVGIEPELRLSEWLGFAVITPLIFGAVFQTPLIMYVLHRVGIVDVEMYQKHRRMAVFALAVLSCLLAATPDAFGMLSLAIPLWCLYELGILLCRIFPRPKSEFEEEIPYTGE